MTEVLFYHLTESTLEDALPALLEKSLERGWRVSVQIGGEERMDSLDTHLWTYRDESFLGHGLASDQMAADQPILLTMGEGNENASQVRFLVDGAAPPPLAGYERIVFMFDGHDQQQVDAARGQWKSLKGEGHALTYWQQTQEGRWERKA